MLTATKRANKVAHYCLTDSDFLPILKNFDSGKMTFQEIEKIYSDLDCSILELETFTWFIIKNRPYICTCSEKCRDFAIFSLAAQKIKNQL